MIIIMLLDGIIIQMLSEGPYNPEALTTFYKIEDRFNRK